MSSFFNGLVCVLEISANKQDIARQIIYDLEIGPLFENHLETTDSIKLLALILKNLEPKHAHKFQ